MVRQFGSGAIAVILLLYPIAVSAQSDTAWVRHYNGPGNGSDRTMAMTVDASGNVFVTGISSGGASYDFATVKYNAAGKTLWERRFNVPGDIDDSPTALAVDNHGNVYVAGISISSGTGSNFALLKYDSDGTLLWNRLYDGPAHSEDWPQAIALSSAHEVYVTGWSGGVGTGRDITTLKYDTDGNLLWERRYNGPINQSDASGTIALDREGNVFVGGSVSVDSADGGEVMVYLTECAIFKYSPAGDLLWERQYQHPDRWSDGVVALEIDGSGNVVAAAAIYGGAASNGDIGVLRYDGGGNFLWAQQYDGPVHLYDAVIDLALAADGCIYVTGTSAGGIDVGRDFTVLKYCADGDFVWEQRYTGPGDRYDDPAGIVVDSRENVCVAGSSPAANLRTDWATLLYDSSGNLFWQERYNGAADAEDGPAALAFTTHGDVIVAGYSTGAASNRDFTTIRYSLPCACDCLHDPAGCDGVADLLDVTEIINVAFRGAASVPDPAARCPIAPSDVDCSYATDILDVVRAINVIFRGADPMSQYVDPCSM